VLKEAGFTEAEIASLVASKAVGVPAQPQTTQKAQASGAKASGG
jgi:hypothetical protein